MLPAYMKPQAADQDLDGAPLPPGPPRWAEVRDYALDRGGPVLRPYLPLPAGFVDMGIGPRLQTVVSQHPHKIAINDGADELSYSALGAAVEILSRRVASAVAQGRPVGIWQPSSVWGIVAMLATMAAGRISIPLNARDPAPRVKEIVSAARLQAMLGMGDRPADLAQDVQWIDMGVSSAAERDMLASPLPPPSVDEPAIILYTSGSTGRPKGIVNSQRSLLWRVQQYVDACHINSDDVFLPLTGLATIAGCREILTSLLSGATLQLVELEAIGLRGVRARMKDQGVTVTYLVPALLRTLMADVAADTFSSLRIARVGGEKVLWADIALLRKAIPPHCLVQIGYSSTETTGSQWFLPPEPSNTEPDVPVGRLLPGISFAILNEEGRAALPGETGELAVKSRYVLLGHWENGAVVPTEADPANPGERIFATGDLVQLDGDGLLRVIGRKGRQIKINGRRIEPAELERVMRSASFVRDAVAVVTEATELIAFAVPNDTAGPDFVDDLRQLIADALPSPLRPLRLHRVDDIPRLSGGKVDLAKLGKMDHLARKPTTVADPPSPGSDLKVRQVVQKAWGKVLNTRAAAGRWDEAGGDSLKLLHCVMEIETLIGQELGLESFTVGMTADQMARAVVAAQAASSGNTAPEHDPPLLFLFPGSVGYGPSLAAFASAMGATAKVVPVRYPGLALILKGQRDLASMADAAVQQINRAQPSGDVRLLGHSLGGAVALEVAVRLLEAGRSVKFVGILDTSLEGERSRLRDTVTRTVRRLRSNRISFHRVACRALAKIAVRLGYESRLARAIDRYTEGQFNGACFRIKLELQEVLRAQAFFRWLMEPKTALPIQGTLFRCARPGMSRAIGWDQVFDDLQVVPIVGSHIDLVVEPHVATNRPLIEKAVLQTYTPAESLQLEGQAA
ncbi:AMP-dependent synthetase [Mesorhizobium sp. M2E.F.Ca.ET.166.01.1.1]|nr:MULTISPECIES: AMP-binding protein [unclassified Mesorhizobium]TGS10549.1 AMP-dependent synthetase [Mesorhizobium sp. M2E.F.Ca.ET.209.01.1.1]TGT65342.1 AMP-dependent synthetase [Mesorhizobium sp. M2E.F.Ca.ET.166.01.1.1]TGV97388.1 AMP-dependent synthetase [Mesorhizobium sp. M2E.F.Ca.ET.154.01.1.1]